MTVRSNRSLLALFTISLILLTAVHPEPLHADGYRFIGTRKMDRHASQLQPKMFTLGKILSSEPGFFYRRPRHLPLLSSLSELEHAPRPLKLGAGFMGASNIQSSGALAGYKNQNLLIIGGYRQDHASSFEDADGTTTLFGYERDSGQLYLHKQPDSEMDLELSAAYDGWKEILLPHYSLDAELFNRHAIQLKSTHRGLSSQIDEIRLTLKHKDLLLDGDNYSYRTPPALLLRLKTERTRTTLRGEMDFSLAPDLQASTGMDISYEAHNTLRYDGTISADSISTYRHPDLREWWASLYGNSTLKLSPGHRLQIGAQYDLITLSANDLHTRPNNTGALASLYNVTAEELYARYYGDGIDTSPTDHNLSLLARLEQDYEASWNTYLEAGRILRSGDHTQRFHANSGPAALINVGNPGLDTEIHYRTAIGGSWKSAGLNSDADPHSNSWENSSWLVEARIWHDDIRNYITGDRARGQDGTLLSDGGIIYRNVNATFSGWEADAMLHLNRHWSTRLSLFGERGQNETDHRPIYQMAPMEANLSLDYHHYSDGIRWNLGTILRMVARQDRVDDSKTTGLGQDTMGETSGFTTVDLYSSFQFNKDLAIGAGINNLFNKLYREHINALPQSSSTKGANAPGREAWVRAIFSF